MGKRTRGKEVKSKNTKEKPSSKIYIFCEGNTEEIYLRHFENRMYNVEVIPVESGHTDAVGIVKYAKDCVNRGLLELIYGDRAYCVFDSDPQSNPNISEAFNLINGMKDKGLDCIFSNPCFEVWFALHFGNVPYGKTAEQMKRHIKQCVKADIPDYSETTDIYKYIEDKQSEAYNRAQDLEKRQKDVHNSVHSHECNPYTDMHKFIGYMDEIKKK